MTNVPWRTIAPYRELFERYGYDIGYLSSDMQLHLATVKTFSDYRTTLSRHMRRNINNFNNKRLTQGVSLEWSQEPRAIVPILNHLLRQTTAKHQHQTTVYPRTFDWIW